MPYNDSGCTQARWDCLLDLDDGKSHVLFVYKMDWAKLDLILKLTADIQKQLQNLW